MSTDRSARRSGSRSTVVGGRLALGLAAFAAGSILVVFILLDPTQEQTASVPVGYDEPEVPLEFSPVEATLVADVTAIRPGASFRAGVLLRMRPGWHVFWKDPGDAGLPTYAELRLPAPFTTGELGWPVPVRFRQPGDLAGFGYADWVLLAATIEAPSELPTAREVPMRARVEWLSCERVCEPGKADLELLLPVGESPRVDAEELFASWQRRLPLTPDAPDQPLSIAVQRRAERDDGTRYDVDLRWLVRPEALEWFPVADAALQIHDVTTRLDETISRLSFLTTRMSETGPAPSRLDSVLAYTDASGVRRGVELRIPLDGSP